MPSAVAAKLTRNEINIKDCVILHVYTYDGDDDMQEVTGTMPMAGSKSAIFFCAKRTSIIVGSSLFAF